MQAPPEFYPDDDRHILYVFVRKDMANNDVAVQSCHAVLEHTAKMGLSKHPALCILEVENENSLLDICQDMSGMNGYPEVDFTAFMENFGKYDNQVTSICAGPLSHSDPRRKLLSCYKLYKGRNKS